jgi:hypothetical protein
VTYVLSINEELARHRRYLPPLHYPSATRHSEDGAQKSIHLKKVKQRKSIRETHNDPVEPSGRNLSGDNCGGFTQHYKNPGWKVHETKE